MGRSASQKLPPTCVLPALINSCRSETVGRSEDGADQSMQQPELDLTAKDADGETPKRLHLATIASQSWYVSTCDAASNHASCVGAALRGGEANAGEWPPIVFRVFHNGTGGTPG